jgi:hypothetical protein
VLGLRGGSRRGALTQLAAWRLACPGTGIDFAHHSQPLLGLGERREVTHMETKALAPFLEAAADEKMKATQLGQIGLRKRHRRRRRA